MSFKAECLAIAIHISDVGAAVKNQYVIKSPQLLRNYLKPMKLTDKRFLELAHTYGSVDYLTTDCDCRVFQKVYDN